MAVLYPRPRPVTRLCCRLPSLCPRVLFARPLFAVHLLRPLPTLPCMVPLDSARARVLWRGAPSTGTGTSPLFFVSHQASAASLITAVRVRQRSSAGACSARPVALFGAILNTLRRNLQFGSQNHFRMSGGKKPPLAETRTKAALGQARPPTFCEAGLTGKFGDDAPREQRDLRL
jgi:hypothetical protein